MYVIDFFCILSMMHSYRYQNDINCIKDINVGKLIWKCRLGPLHRLRETVLYSKTLKKFSTKLELITGFFTIQSTKEKFL